MSVADLTTDLSGWALGEKKLIKEEHEKTWGTESKKLAELKLGVEIDFPSFAANSKDGEKDNDVKKYPKLIYTKFLAEYTKELQTFAKNQSLLEELQHVCTKLVFRAVAFNSKGVRATFEIKDKVLIASLNPYYWCYSSDPDAMTKWLLANQRAKDGSKWTWGEMKLPKEAESKVWADEQKKFAVTGLTMEIDFKSIQEMADEGSDCRKYIGSLYSKFVVEYSAALIKFCSNADYKEALNDAAKKVVFNASKLDSKGVRATYAVADKAVVITLNPYYWNYSVDPNNLVKHLEKSL